jgi:hypothetical protein
MKKPYQFLIITAIFLYSLTNQSQAQNTSQLNYGVRVGASSSCFAQSAQEFSHKKTGITAGGFVNYMLKDWVGLTGEINYLQEGVTHISPEYIYPEFILSQNAFPKIYSDVTIHAIDVPVLVHFYPLPGVNRIVPKFGTGISFNYIARVKSKDLVTDNEHLFTTTQTTDVSSFFNSTNFGILFSGGLNFVTNKHTYLFDVRYKFGLKNISNLSGYSHSADHAFTSNTFTITLGITI